MSLPNDLFDSLPEINQFRFRLISTGLEQNSQSNIDTLSHKVNGICEKWPDHFNSLFVILASDSEGHDATISDEGVIAVHKHFDD